MQKRDTSVKILFRDAFKDMLKIKRIRSALVSRRQTGYTTPSETLEYFRRAFATCMLLVR